MSSVPEGVIATRLIGYVLVLGNLGWLVYYYGWVWTMTQFMYEYTSWSFLPVPDPASWIDMRFSLNWGLYAALIFNLFPCYILLWIMLRPDYSFRYFIHAASIALAGLIDILWLIWYILWVWIWQNNSTVWPFSVVNSVNFCCKNFGAVASSYACHNFHDCIDLPPVPTIRLNTNPIFEDHLLGMTFCFVFLLLHTVANVAIRTHGQSAAGATAAPSPTLPQPGNGGPMAPGLRLPASDSQNILHGFNTVYVALACILLIFGLLVLDVRHTHQYPANGPIGIRSARNSVEAVGLVMSATVIVMPALILIIMAVYQMRWLLYLVFILILLLALVHLFAWFTMIYSRGTANRPGFPNSMANHPLRCCAGDVYSDPQSECDNAGPCNLPVQPFPWILPPLSSSQIPYCVTHQLIFWVMFALLILDVVCIVMVANLYVGRDQVRGAWTWLGTSLASSPSASANGSLSMPMRGSAMVSMVPSAPPSNMSYPPPVTQAAIVLHQQQKFSIPGSKSE